MILLSSFINRTPRYRGIIVYSGSESAKRMPTLSIVFATVSIVGGGGGGGGSRVSCGGEGSPIASLISASIRSYSQCLCCRFNNSLLLMYAVLISSGIIKKSFICGKGTHSCGGDRLSWRRAVAYSLGFFFWG